MFQSNTTDELTRSLIHYLFKLTIESSLTHTYKIGNGRKDRVIHRQCYSLNKVCHSMYQLFILRMEYNAVPHFDGR